MILASRLDVDNLSAEINLSAEVASIVTINAGVQVGIEKVNITISDVEAELELIIRLGNRKFFFLVLFLFGTFGNMTSWPCDQHTHPPEQKKG